MKIGLWADNVNFPSLPLMKLSAYHKARGDAVTMLLDPMERFDLAYCSKTFNLPGVKKIPRLDFYPNADRATYGGTGYAITVENGKEVYRAEGDPPLPKEVEHIYPDYGLYPEFTKNTAYGFLTRGCPNGCGFCVASRKDGRESAQAAELGEFLRGQKTIKLMDANILACKDRERLIESLIESKASVDYTQGLDARLVNDDTAKLICRTKIETVHFAFDRTEDETAILRGLKTFKKYFRTARSPCKVYILTNYDTAYAEDWRRAVKVAELGYRPDIRIYRKGTQGRFLTDLAHWANNPRLYNSCRFEDFVPRKDGRKCGELYADILRSAA